MGRGGAPRLWLALRGLPAGQAELQALCPTLFQLLQHGRPLPGCPGSLDERLWQLFGLAAEPGRDLPQAAATHCMDCPPPHAGVWMRADPVHLSVRLDGMFLYAGNDLDLGRDEAEALAESLRGTLRGPFEGLQVGGAPERWYLPLERLPDLLTVAPGCLAGRSVEQQLPRGDDAAGWRRLGNEAQMLLHQHPVNRRREREGRPTVNSLWFWGAGELPRAEPPLVAALWSDDPLSRGLALHTGIPLAPLPDSAEAWLRQGPSGDCLVVLDGLRDSANGLVEGEWLQTLKRRLRWGRLSGLCLLGDRFGTALRPADLWHPRLWRDRPGR